MILQEHVHVPILSPFWGGGGGGAIYLWQILHIRDPLQSEVL